MNSVESMHKYLEEQQLLIERQINRFKLHLATFLQRSCSIFVKTIEVFLT